MLDNNLPLELKARLAQSEDAWVERKPSFNEHDVRRTVVGFANSLGSGQTAVMFIGADNGGKHRGLAKADETEGKILNALQRCYPAIPFQTYVMPVDVEGRQIEIVAIVVRYSENRPHFTGRAYVRRGSSTIEASREMFLELIASQNEKARRLLQFKGRKVWFRISCESGLWYEHEGIIDFCDAATIRLTQMDGQRVLWTFSTETIQMRDEEYRGLLILAKADCSEEQHIRTMVIEWSNRHSIRNFDEHGWNPNDLIASQFLANPARVLQAISALADCGRNPWLSLLLVHIRFALKQIKKSMTREQKLMHFRAILKQSIAKDPIAGAVTAAIDAATSIDEARGLLKSVIKRHDPIHQAQLCDLLEVSLGMPRKTSR